MPLGPSTHLDELYGKQRLVAAEIDDLERALDRLDTEGPEGDRYYILALERRALLEESTRLGSCIDDILERDLQR